MGRHGGYKCELNNVTHEGHKSEVKKEQYHFYHAAEVGVGSSANTYFQRRKSTFSTIGVEMIAIILMIFLYLALSLSPSFSNLFSVACSKSKI